MEGPEDMEGVLEVDDIDEDRLSLRNIK